MKVQLPYGKESIEVLIPNERVTEIRPQFIPGLQDEAHAFKNAVWDPIGSPPLKNLIDANDKVAVVIPDFTRALPSERLLPWLFNELVHVPKENFTIILGTGTHRQNTAEEIETMVGKKVAMQFQLVNHNGFNPSTLQEVGKREGGYPVMLNKTYVQADKRIIMGFIEPHFMAGFSGGFKAVFPGIADIASIQHYHRASVIQNPRSTWGVLENNPTQEQIQRYGSLVPIDFCINVTLNHQHQITQFFCGNVSAAHQEGCRFAKSTAMISCLKQYPLVITSNSGFPLDQNLYQSVKGMSGAAQIVAPDGLIVIAARCNDGFPNHGSFRQMLFDYTPKAFLEALHTPPFQKPDQWQNQLLSLILLKARVAVYSDLDAEEVQRAHMEPIEDLNAFIAKEIRQYGKDIPVAVLPEGPMTIPFLA